MSKQLRVDVEQLCITADLIDMHAADLRHEHSAAHADMASAVPGFGASMSAKALNDRIAQWERETEDHHAELGRHGEGHRVAGTSYASSDVEARERITVSDGEIKAVAP